MKVKLLLILSIIINLLLLCVVWKVFNIKENRPQDNRTLGEFVNFYLKDSISYQASTPDFSAQKKRCIYILSEDILILEKLSDMFLKTNVNKRPIFLMPISDPIKKQWGNFIVNYSTNVKMFKTNYFDYEYDLNHHSISSNFLSLSLKNMKIQPGKKSMQHLEKFDSLETIFKESTPYMEEILDREAEHTYKEIRGK